MSSNATPVERNECLAGSAALPAMLKNDFQKMSSNATPVDQIECLAGSAALPAMLKNDLQNLALTLPLSSEMKVL